MYNTRSVTVSSHGQSPEEKLTNLVILLPAARCQQHSTVPFICHHATTLAQRSSNEVWVK